MEVEPEVEELLDTVTVCAGEHTEAVVCTESGSGSVSKFVPPVYLIPHGDLTDIRVCMSDDRLLMPEM